MPILVITFVISYWKTRVWTKEARELSQAIKTNVEMDLANVTWSSRPIGSQKNKKPYKLIEDSIFIFLNMSTDIIPYVVKIAFKLSFDFVRIEYK